MSKVWYAQSVDGIEVFSTPAGAQSHAEALLDEVWQTSIRDGEWPPDTELIEWGAMDPHEQAQPSPVCDSYGRCDYELVAAKGPSGGAITAEMVEAAVIAHPDYGQVCRESSLHLRNMRIALEAALTRSERLLGARR